MKYIITESQLDKIIFRYLDKMDYHVIKRFVKPNEHESFLQYHLTNDINSGYSDITYKKMSKTLYVTKELCQSIEDLFSLSQYEALSIISDWVSSKIKQSIYRDYCYYRDSLPGEQVFKID
jgi:hypothetical protein